MSTLTVDEIIKNPPMIRMRKVTSDDLFGIDEKEPLTKMHMRNAEQCPKVAGFRKQAEYGEKKRIKP